MDEEERLRQLGVAAQAAKSAADECTTIQEYTLRIIDALRNGDEQAVAQYSEIIGDELNHAYRFLMRIYTPMTGIEPDTDGLEDSV